MNRQMKIMIAFDGSVYSAAAINDLSLAGLPRLGKVSVVTVHDAIPPASFSDFELIKKASPSLRVLSTVALIEKQTAEAFKNLQISLAGAVDDVRFYLPEWEIDSKALTGNPAQSLLGFAETEQPDLIIAGSHGRTALGRFFLGSVSTELANKARCAVRIVRDASAKSINPARRIIAAVDNSPAGEAVVRHIGNRVWNDDTEIRLVAVDDGVSPHRISSVLPNKEQMLDWAVERLEEIGLKVSAVIIKGDSKIVLLAEAESWKATSIFAAANRKIDDSALDEISVSLINGADCAVEIIRQ